MGQDHRRRRVVSAALSDWRTMTALELIRARFDAGRAERGLTDEPFVWDHPELGVDELQELIDAAIYRCERYRAWYGTNESRWPYSAWERMQAATAAIEELRVELKHGPRSVMACACR